jgi:hypothetical protein
LTSDIRPTARKTSAPKKNPHSLATVRVLIFGRGERI